MSHTKFGSDRFSRFDVYWEKGAAQLFLKGLVLILCVNNAFLLKLKFFYKFLESKNVEIACKMYATF